MAHHVFKYKLDQSGTAVYRPFVKVVMTSGERSETIYALVDSGADYCVFPASLIETLGLKEADVERESDTHGFGSPVTDKTKFWTVSLTVEEKVSITVPVGFAEGQNEVGWGVLGMYGFFNQFLKVAFCDGYFFVETR